VKAFSLLDDDLAPTPISEVEERRNIHLRQNGHPGRSDFDPRKRTSLEDFVDKLKKQSATYEANEDILYDHDPYNHYQDHPNVLKGLESLDQSSTRLLHGVVDEIVMETLEDDVIPDMLIEVLLEAKENPNGDRKPFQPLPVKTLSIQATKRTTPTLGDL